MDHVTIVTSQAWSDARTLDLNFYFKFVCYGISVNYHDHACKINISKNFVQYVGGEMAPGSRALVAL